MYEEELKILHRYLHITYSNSRSSHLLLANPIKTTLSAFLTDTVFFVFKDLLLFLSARPRSELHREPNREPAVLYDARAARPAPAVHRRASPQGHLC